MEAFDLAVGLRPIRSSALVLDAELVTGIPPQVRAVGAAVVGQDPLDGDPVGVESLNSPHQHGRGCHGGFVVVDLGVGNAGVVVDHGVDVGLAHQRVVVLVLRLVRGGGAVLLALSAADVAPASAVGDVAELLHVDVEHRAGMVVLIATDRLPGGTVDMGQPVQVRVGQDPVNRRRSDPQPAGQLHGTFSETDPQQDATLRRRWTALVGRVVRARRSILHGLAGAVALCPALHGRPGDLEAGGDLADRPALVNDETGDDQAVAWGERGVGVRHEGAFLGGHHVPPRKAGLPPWGGSWSVGQAAAVETWSTS